MEKFLIWKGKLVFEVNVNNIVQFFMKKCNMFVDLQIFFMSKVVSKEVLVLILDLFFVGLGWEKRDVLL